MLSVLEMCASVRAMELIRERRAGGTGKYIIERERVVKENGWELELE